MHIQSQVNTLRKGALIYRFIRYQKGFGVHSPFVFNLITKVIEEKYGYYSYYDIELLRKELLFHEEKITYSDRHDKGNRKTRTVSEIVKHEAIKAKHGALLFRLTNYFKSKNIIQVGVGVGLSTLYLTSYSKGLRCIALDDIPEFAQISKKLYAKGGRNPIDLRTGSYTESLPKALKDMQAVDFIYFNTLQEQKNNLWLFKECLPYAQNNSVFVFEGIQESQEMRDFWKEVCASPEVTVTIDLYSMGIVLFNKRLHKRDYIVYF